MRHRIGWVVVLFAAAWPARAGMTFYDLNDVVRLRLEEISFFALVLVLCAFGVRFLWNHVAEDFQGWPRLTVMKAFCLTTLLSLLMLLVLSMISGARELLTPGAWRRQGNAYRLNGGASEAVREQSLASLRTVLFAYADAHAGSFPPHDFVAGVPEKLWQTPDAEGSRYIYLGGTSAPSKESVLACEPMAFGNERFVLFADGEIRKLTTEEIRKRVEGN